MPVSADDYDCMPVYLMASGIFENCLGGPSKLETRQKNSPGNLSLLLCEFYRPPKIAATIYIAPFIATQVNVSLGNFKCFWCCLFFKKVYTEVPVNHTIVHSATFILSLINKQQHHEKNESHKIVCIIRYRIVWKSSH